MADWTLCGTCQLLFSYTSFNAPANADHEIVIENFARTDLLPDLQRLHRDAERGCPFCAELMNRISEKVGLWPDGVEVTIGPAILYLESSSNLVLTSEQEDVWAVVIIVDALGCDLLELHYNLFANDGSYGNLQLRVRCRPPCTDRCSLPSIEILRQWMTNCAEEHPRCESEDDLFFPKRLIDVGLGDGSREPKIVELMTKPSQYAVLSHCWGTPGPELRLLRTLTSNIELFQRAIPQDSMPRNFQDAVSITRALNIPYLWVDSLCIIQDSKDDWAREGSMMDKIYKCAWVSFAATSASTCEDGFLQCKFAERMFTVPLAKNPEQKQCEALDVTRPDRLYVRFAGVECSPPIVTDVEQSVWNRRGWTMQERLLARRTIHFGAGQMYWECRNGFACESGQQLNHFPTLVSPPRESHDVLGERNPQEDFPGSQGGEGIDTPDSGTKRLSGSSLLNEASGTSLAKTRLYSWWFQVLNDYSDRKLTYPSDKLPAISGLAKELCAAHKDITGHDDQYLAGIWMGALADCLLWLRGESVNITGTGVTGTPTWSWARCGGSFVPKPLHCPNMDPESNLIQYVDHTIVLDSANKYGNVLSSTLRVRAGLVRIVLTRSENREKVHWQHKMHLPGTTDSVGAVTLDRDEGQCKQQPHEYELYAMQVKVQPKRPYSWDWDYCGLMLQPTHEPLTFQRVGVFSLKYEYLDFFSFVEKNVITLV